jgi:hypothetical protein
MAKKEGSRMKRLAEARRRRSAWLPSLFALFSLVPAHAGADDVLYDYARVVWVDPVTVETQTPVLERICVAAPARVEGLGELRRGADVPGLAAAIRREADREAAAPACEDHRTARTERRVIGYRVVYRYGGETYERTVDEDPGERLRVRVSLRPAGTGVR